MSCKTSAYSSSTSGTSLNNKNYYLNISGEKKGLDGYQKKKYVAKLLFIFLLGHEVDFGHLEAVNLLTSLTYSEKQIVREVER